MRLIIAGSRSITDKRFVEEAIEASGFKPTVVFCGGARGVDSIGEDWARRNGIQVEHYLPEYDRAGKGSPLLRNKLMAENADALLAIWDGKSTGTMHMLRCALDKGLEVRLAMPHLIALWKPHTKEIA